MQIDVEKANIVEVYQKLVDIVNPRPIAWVTSIDPEGRVNLAPFSFFNAFGANPAVLGFAPSLRRDGTKKDTLRNVEATEDFVINVAVAGLAEQVNLSSKELPPGESEVELTGLSVSPSIKIKTPRLNESPVNLECVLRQVLVFGEGPRSANLVIGEVVLMHVADSVLDENGRVDPNKLATIGRLGGDYYCRTTDNFRMKRP